MDNTEKTMIVTNKGRRTWPVKNAAGDMVRLEPMESVEMREIDALRLINGYPLDIAQAGPATMSSANLERAEQSLRDRIANVEKREKACEERERKSLTVFEAIEALAPFLSDEGTAYLAENDSAWKDGKTPEEKKEPVETESKKRGRPAKAD